MRKENPRETPHERQRANKRWSAPCALPSPTHASPHASARRLRWPRFGALLLALAVAPAPAVAAPAAAPPGAAGPTRTVAPAMSAAGISVDGTIEAVGQAVLASQISGRVLELRADAGQSVAAGATLARIDAREAAEAVAAAEARVAEAKAALTRVEDLQRRQFVSAAALDQARAEHAAARAALLAAQASQSHAMVLAPFAGVIARRHVEQGDMAAPGRALFTLYQPGALRVVAQLPQTTALALRAAGAQARAQIEVAGLAQPIEASRIQILPTADAATHVVEVRLELPRAASATLLPGGAARVRFVFGRSERVTLPPAAIVHRGGIAAAYVQDAQGRFQLRQLRLGEATPDGEVEILAGLVAGETVALDPVKAGIARRLPAAR